GMDGGEAGGGGGGGLLQQILSLRLVPRVGNGTTTYSSPLSTFPGTSPLGAGPPAGAAGGLRAALTALLSAEMWYGVFLWALVSSLAFHVPAALLALFTLRHHKYGRFMSVSVLLMGIVGPITAGTLTSAAIAGVYRAAGKKMIPFEALIFGVGQTFCVVVVSFLRILATL
ncbi:T170A protein, partial [Chloropsis hardwickii]|nr:T170A protein [Chloropsis hardwickii]